MWVTAVFRDATLFLSIWTSVWTPIHRGELAVRIGNVARISVPKPLIKAIRQIMKNMAEALRLWSATFAPKSNYRRVVAAWMTRRVVPTALVLLIASGALANPANAAADDAAVAFMRNLLTRAVEVMNDKVSLADREARFRQMFRADFDAPRIARFVLGPYWRQASPAEQQQFLELFENYVVLVYSTRFADFGGGTFEVRGAPAAGRGGIVSTDIFTPGGRAPLRIDWQLVSDGGGDFKIVDVIVKGVSMMVTERSEFASVIRRHGGNVGELLALMREKTTAGTVAVER
jgi:phospholipid transport system substrate-binding protein